MSEGQVDLSQIRGDWHFHTNYVANAVDATIKRAIKYLKQIENEVEVGNVAELVNRQAEIWSQISSDCDAKGAIKPESPAVQEFIEVTRSTKEPCDAIELAENAGGSASIYDTPLEHFTEACRQNRGFCDDLELLRDTRPNA